MFPYFGNINTPHLKPRFVEIYIHLMHTIYFNHLSMCYQKSRTYWFPFNYTKNKHTMWIQSFWRIFNSSCNIHYRTDGYHKHFTFLHTIFLGKYWNVWISMILKALVKNIAMNNIACWDKALHHQPPWVFWDYGLMPGSVKTTSMVTKNSNFWTTIFITPITKHMNWFVFCFYGTFAWHRWYGAKH